MGEVFRHIALGRLNWLARISAPQIERAVADIPEWFTDSDGTRHIVEEAIRYDSAQILAEWLQCSWTPIQAILQEWTVENLFEMSHHRFRGTDYLISRQWVLWRILSHDIHHGGQIAAMLAAQNIDAFELRSLGGHITVPPLCNTRG